MRKKVKFSFIARQEKKYWNSPFCAPSNSQSKYIIDFNCIDFSFVRPRSIAFDRRVTSFCRVTKIYIVASLWIKLLISIHYRKKVNLVRDNMSRKKLLWYWIFFLIEVAKHLRAKMIEGEGEGLSYVRVWVRMSVRMWMWVRVGMTMWVRVRMVMYVRFWLLMWVRVSMFRYGWSYEVGY